MPIYFLSTIVHSLKPKLASHTPLMLSLLEAIITKTQTTAEVGTLFVLTTRLKALVASAVFCDAKPVLQERVIHVKPLHVCDGQEELLAGTIRYRTSTAVSLC